MSEETELVEVPKSVAACVRDFIERRREGREAGFMLAYFLPVPGSNETQMAVFDFNDNNWKIMDVEGKR